MIRLKLADYWDLYGIRDIKWGYTDFAKEFADGEYLGYGVLNVDAGGVGFDIIDLNNDAINTSYLCTNVAVRPSMCYSYIKEFCEDVKDLGNGYFEVTFGEYPKSKITDNVDVEKLIKTGKQFTIKQNNKLVQLYEFVDELGNKMVNVNGNFYKVEPLVWLASTHKNIMITKDAINGGFAYDRQLTLEEEARALIGDSIPRKLSERALIHGRIRNTEKTLVEQFITQVLSYEIVNEKLVNKIKTRDIEKNKKDQEEKAKLEAIEKEKNKLKAEKDKVRRAKRRHYDYFFPRNAWSAMYYHNYNEEEIVEMNRLVEIELPNVKHYVNDKEELLYLIIDLYKGKDAQERRMPYPKERYDACRSNLERFDIDYLNVVLKEVIGNNKYLDSHIEYLIEHYEENMRK